MAIRGATFAGLLAAPFWVAIFYAGAAVAAVVLLAEAILALLLGFFIEDTSLDDAYDTTVFGQPADTFEAITAHLDIEWPTNTEGEQ